MIEWRERDPAYPTDDAKETRRERGQSAMDDSLEVAGLKADSEASREAIEGAKASILRYAMPPEGYNGWTNHATWDLNLHLTQDEYTVNGATEAAQAEAEAEDGGPASFHLIGLAVKEWCEDYRDTGRENGCEDHFDGIDFDLVNWPEIAGNLLSSADPA